MPKKNNKAHNVDMINDKRTDLQRVFMRLTYGSVYNARKVRILAESQLLKDYFPLNKQILVQLLPGEGDKFSYKPSLVDNHMTKEVSWYRQFLYLASIIRKYPNIRRVHSHGYSGTILIWLARLIYNKKYLIIQEIHGVLAFESYYNHNKSLSKYLRFITLYMLESMSMIMSDRLLLVSALVAKYYPIIRLRESVSIPRYIINDYATDDEKIPNQTLDQFRIFSQLARAKNKRIIVYCGSANKWQMPRETIQLMSEFIKNSQFCGAIFTGDSDLFKRYINKYSPNSSNWFVGSLRSRYIMGALEICDIGVLLREDIILNRVASPTKLYEYAVSGLFIITTDGISAAERIVKDQKYGELVHLDSMPIISKKTIASIYDQIQIPMDCVAVSEAKLRYSFTARKKIFMSLYR
jgi:hypothetical protein